jgi:hypothetical protein
LGSVPADFLLRQARPPSRQPVFFDCVGHIVDAAFKQGDAA